MPWGLNDDIADLRDDLHEMRKFLAEIAIGKKTADDARTWLLKNYPEICFGCGHPYQVEKFCTLCGYKHGPRRIGECDPAKGEERCLKCQAVITPGSAFCGSCGNKK
jgi:hypothetical protein